MRWKTRSGELKSGLHIFKWHKWFAWYPVLTWDGWIWMETVVRKRAAREPNPFQHEPYYYYWEYQALNVYKQFKGE